MYDTRQSSPIEVCYVACPVEPEAVVSYFYTLKAVLLILNYSFQLRTVLREVLSPEYWF